MLFFQQIKEIVTILDLIVKNKHFIDILNVFPFFPITKEFYGFQISKKFCIEGMIKKLIAAIN